MTAPSRPGLTSAPLSCLCCGRRVVNANPRQPLHLGCWTEHHSDPTGVWPPEHDCQLDSTDPCGQCGHDAAEHDAPIFGGGCHVCGDCPGWEDT